MSGSSALDIVGDEPMLPVVLFATERRGNARDATPELMHVARLRIGVHVRAVDASLP